MGTKTDNLRKEIKETYEDDSDEDDSDKTNIKEIINIRFNSKLTKIRNDLEDKITNNEKLSLRGITSNDIHILLTSSTLKNSKISGFDNFTNKLNEIIDYRACKIKTELKILIEKIYKDFDDYINRPRHEIDEENKLLIEKESSRVK